jgi:LuxR family transcriptional regulator, maltose regulon positive regulatory protein
MERTDPLIRTKLRLPFIRPSLVPRPRLQARIAEGLAYPLTLVVAPAGFGKTTLVAASLAEGHKPIAWLSLDRGDNQTRRFLTYLVAALHSVDPHLGREATQLLAGLPEAVPEAVLTSLINDLDEASGEMVLVLDDYQFISSPSVHESLTFLLEHCPQTLHLLIATRSDPPLPLARLRARGQIVELRAADLRFTAAEAARFLSEVMGLDLDAGAVEVLERRTEGWVAGLQMAALSLRDRQDVPGFIIGFSGTNRHILDYLVEEVLAGQPEDIQHFLLCTSILERLSAALCEAVLRDEGEKMKAETLVPSSFISHPSAIVLEYLERTNLFLVPLDDERRWYRYHHLFADLLRVRLQQEQADLIPRLHVRASAWLEQNEFIAEAIQHLFAAHEIDRAADLIERYGTAYWARGDPSVIQLADGLPPEMLITRPKIGLCQAWILIIHAHIKKALPLLHDLERQLARADPASEQQWIQTIVQLALAFLAPAGSNTEPLPGDHLLDEIPADELILRDTAEILYGMALGRREEIDRAAEVSLRWIQRKKTPRETLGIPTLVAFLSRVYLMQGRLGAAAALCHEYLDPIKERGFQQVFTTGSMNIDLGEALYEQNCLDEAEQHIREGLRANEPWQNIMTDGHGLSDLARVLQAKGDTAGAMEIVEKFEAKWERLARPREFDEDFCTLRPRLWLASGDQHRASQWADQVQTSEDFQRQPAYYWLTLARIRLAQGRYADVEEMLKRMPPLSSDGNRITKQLEHHLTLAAAVAGQSGLPEALRLIESSLALAEPEGYVRVFVDLGEPVRELLVAYLRSDAPGHKLYAQTLLEAFSPSRGSSPRPPQPAELNEPLSERELEVLALMALGLTNPEIARQLVVAPGTVKAHAASIYRKLDVANRTEAVTRARRLNLLP